MGARKIAKRARITGRARIELGSTVAVKYKNGMTIRAIAAETGRSYGAIHRLLREEGLPMRPRRVTQQQGESVDRLWRH